MWESEPGRDAPVVAVVIPVHRQADELAATVSAIVGDEPFRDRLRIIVVVDGADVRTEATARAYADEVVVLPEALGAPTARNVGVAHALAHPQPPALLAFTRPGLRPEPGWLAAHRWSLALCELSVGPVFMRTVGGPVSVLDAVLTRGRGLYPRPTVSTANLVIHATVAEAVRFGPPGELASDEQFAARAVDAGFALGYNEEAAMIQVLCDTVVDVRGKLQRMATGRVAGTSSRTDDIASDVDGPSLDAVAERLGVKLRRRERKQLIDLVAKETSSSRS